MNAVDTNLHPQLSHEPVALNAELQHITGGHTHLEAQAGGHRNISQCPACAAGRDDHPLPKEVIEMMAKREHRMHHWLWHEVRNNWHQYPSDIQAKIEDLGWRPPRPVQDENGNPDLGNDSGEDFLYMHRQMIADVNAILAQVKDPNYPRVKGWLVVPSLEDPSYPVPPAWFDPESQAPNLTPFASLERIKSDIFYQKRFRFWQRTFTDPTFLRSVTLGELGVIIELTIHSAMHMRWAASMGTTRPNPLQVSGEVDPTGGEAIGMEWDDPRYDFLGDTYSSHVNPIFWKLHGWIDDRVEGWKTANGIFGNDFWKGTWLGRMPGHEEEGTSPALHGAHEHTISLMSEMQEVTNLIASTGVFHKPFSLPFFMED
jgi:hypothetical protein